MVSDWDQYRLNTSMTPVPTAVASMIDDVRGWVAVLLTSIPSGSSAAGVSSGSSASATSGSGTSSASGSTGAAEGSGSGSTGGAEEAYSVACVVTEINKLILRNSEC